MVQFGLVQYPNGWRKPPQEHLMNDVYISSSLGVRIRLIEREQQEWHVRTMNSEFKYLVVLKPIYDSLSITPFFHHIPKSGKHSFPHGKVYFLKGMHFVRNTFRRG
jgi:hypothetical protein